MRIDVAIDAGCKLHIFVACWATGHIGLVALLARNLNVRAGQGISRFRVIKLLGGFPVRKVVALQAIVPELSLVWIFVTRHAILRQPKERS